MKSIAALGLLFLLTPAHAELVFEDEQIIGRSPVRGPTQHTDVSTDVHLFDDGSRSEDNTHKVKTREQKTPALNLPVGRPLHLLTKRTHQRALQDDPTSVNTSETWTRTTFTKETATVRQ